MDPLSDNLNARQLEYVDYIGKISLELARIAQKADLRMLAYLLDMVAQEAGELQQVNRFDASPEALGGRRPRSPRPSDDA